MPVTLDPTPLRSLTNREISLLLCAMLNGVAEIEPSTTTEFREVIGLSKKLLDDNLDAPGETLRQLCQDREVSTWRIAFGATVCGLKHWCQRVDIELAIMWVDENLDRMFRNQLN